MKTKAKIEKAKIGKQNTPAVSAFPLSAFRFSP
jgi:hypothetical protein